MAQAGVSTSKLPVAKEGFSAVSNAALKEQAAALKAAGVAPRTAAAKAVDNHLEMAGAHRRTAAARFVAKSAQTGVIVSNLGGMSGAGFGWSGPMPGGGSGTNPDTGSTPGGDPRPWVLLTPVLQLQLLQAVQYGVMMFTSLAHFRALAVNGPLATGHTGCLTGPDIASQISAAPFVASLTRGDAEMREAVADGVAGCFAAWRDAVTAPNLTFWPAFLAYPAAYAPPMANVPTPIGLCLSTGASRITVAGELANAIFVMLPATLRTPEGFEFVAKLSLGLAPAFAAWLTTTHVTNVMGRGPVPLFQPPFSMFGPVTGGSIIEAPGHLATSPPMPVIPVPF
ncbi:hypothetical protein [Rubrimonas cliftonensis]|uniref:Uncharacterized protein n=1 Tax=Rubrimonas cliftonensis TaxID=89524 RepID=A0A1H3VS23_9RHOB|nr:hypothetical protein [Rubrimonas cliftonensis]SDZ77625.1 hypothetical protein SAMN05444370_101293 [Rubrimonas cliftonensis]